MEGEGGVIRMQIKPFHVTTSKITINNAVVEWILYLKQLDDFTNCHLSGVEYFGYIEH